MGDLGARPFATASKFPGGGVARDGGPTLTGARPFGRRHKAELFRTLRHAVAAVGVVFASRLRLDADAGEAQKRLSDLGNRGVALPAVEENARSSRAHERLRRERSAEHFQNLRTRQVVAKVRRSGRTARHRGDRRVGRRRSSWRPRNDGGTGASGENG